jgi:hypothetical protein
VLGLTIALLPFTCALSYIPGMIWAKPVLPMWLRGYAMNPAPYHAAAFLIFLLLLVVVWLIKPIKLGLRTTIVVVALVLLAGAVSALDLFMGWIMETTVSSQVQFESYEYYLIDKGELSGYRREVYECDLVTRMCHKIPYSRSAGFGVPARLRLDTPTRTLYMLDPYGRVVDTYHLPD